MQSWSTRWQKLATTTIPSAINSEPLDTKAILSDENLKFPKGLAACQALLFHMKVDKDHACDKMHVTKRNIWKWFISIANQYVIFALLMKLCDANVSINSVKHKET